MRIRKAIDKNYYMLCEFNVATGWHALAEGSGMFQKWPAGQRGVKPTPVRGANHPTAGSGGVKR